MEVTLAGGFGHKVQVINGEEDELTKAIAAVFSATRVGGGVPSIVTFLCMYI